MEHIEAIQTSLLRWYQKNRRNLPFRRTRNPYYIWIAEVMLQQTQAETVIPYYLRFTERFPDIHSLARAEMVEVLKLWEGLGYYARARHLRQTARLLVSEFQGELPHELHQLRRLPGIGEYTAAAVASIAYDLPVPVLDGNVRRVLTRWTALPEDPSSSSGVRELKSLAEVYLSKSQPGTWNQAIMELGALVCRPRNPICEGCPVRKFCRALHLGVQDQIPAPRRRAALPHYQVTAGLIRNNGKLLISRRFECGLLGGLWEFPGGKQEREESLSECLQRELREELAIEVEVGEKVLEIGHGYTHFKITLHVFECRYLAGAPQALGCAEWRWVMPAELAQLPFPRADQKVIEFLQG